MISLLAESWTWYAFATLVLVARYISRWIQLGSIKAFQTEDYIMILVFGFYTTLVTCMNIVAHLDTNLMLPSDIPLLTPESIKSRIHGSKLVLVVEQSMITTVWGCKICLLLMYNKLTFGLKQQLAVKIVGCYVVVNWLVMEVLYFGVWCRPFNQYWAVPVANIQCSTALHHLIVNAVFNISSDIMMLCIPLPLLITSQLPRIKKLVLCVLFGLGVFVIMCAVLNKYYSFTNPFSPMWTFWYIREASTAILVANMPMCWSLMRTLFNFRAFNSANASTNNVRSRSRSVPIAATYGSKGLTKSNASKNGALYSTGRAERKDSNGEISWWERNDSRLSTTESEENIIGKGRKDVPLEIWESRQVDVEMGTASMMPQGTGHRGSPDQVNEGATVRIFDGLRKPDKFESRTVIKALASGPTGPGKRSTSRDRGV